MREVLTAVPAEAGGLRAMVRFPEADGPLPGVVLVDGALEGTADSWGSFPEILAGFGVAVLSHDKPGCGGSPGSWLDQTFHGRARETLAAVELLASQPGVDRGRIGLVGVSQGGWVAMIAASMAPEAISHIVSMSGGGVSVREAERYRLSSAVAGDAEAMAFADERLERMAAGEDPELILEWQRAYADRPWHGPATFAYDQLDFLRWCQLVIDFDPISVLPQVRCPVFAAFGGADPDMPAARNITILASTLPASPRHALAVYPGANHGLLIAGQDESAPLGDQLAPGFLAMLETWLKAS